MNKETRIFIWGLIGTLMCCTAVAIHLHGMIEGTWSTSALNIFLFIVSLGGVISFGSTLYKSMQ